MLHALATALLAGVTALAAPVPTDDPPPVEPDVLGAAPNVHRAGDLFFSGQFSQDDVAALAARGIERVITLRTAGEVSWDERAALEQAGIELLEIPLRAPDTFTDDAFHALRASLAAPAAGPTLLHCGSANRVGGLWIPYRTLDQGVPLERAVAEAREIGLRTDGYETRARAYVARQLARARLLEPASVNEGINTSFLDPELDVSSYVERFETESREIYLSRAAIVDALELEPGDRVADVGAGTGLFTHLFAERVGEDGWVFAVDIAPAFLENIRARCAEDGTRHVSTVLCPEDAIGLPPGSADVIFVCDTYHHFEYPRATSASIYDALRPGGRLVVIDFHRIPGVTRDWLLGHVRADQATFRSEIESVGLVHLRDVDVPGLEENYTMVFVRPE